MKISTVLSAVLLTTGFVALAKFGSDLYAATQNYGTIENLGELAEGRTAWIDATVALSLERSVTQVALSLEDPAPAEFLDLIEQQRELSDRLFLEAEERALANEALEMGAFFVTQAGELRASVATLRTEVDAMLSRPASERSAERAHDLPQDLKAVIARLKNLSDVLRIENNLTSSNATALAAIQDRAWEVREFGGRARTYYAIATLSGRPFSQEAEIEVYLSSLRAADAWGIIMNLASGGALNEDLSTSISEADEAYFTGYIAILSSLDAAIAAAPDSGPVDYPLTFETFFAESNQALGLMSDLSASAGGALVAYWEARSDEARGSLIFNALVVLGVTAIVGAGMFAVRRRVTSRIEYLTSALVAVAEGEYDQTVELKKGDLSEIVALAESLRVLKVTLAEGAAVNSARLADQALQEKVVSTLSHSLQQLSQGDLTSKIEETFGGPYDGLKDDYNATCDQLSHLIGSVVSNSQGIESASGHVRSATSDLSERTQKQAASLEETASALEELTTSVKSTATVASQANGRVAVAKKNAQDGNNVVGEAVEAMKTLKSTSEQISQINGLIDDIAFQTSLLALNASIEAAHAGAAGRGFAVVASEVQALAQRTSQAAKQIDGLISSSSSQVNHGVACVDQTGASLTTIVQVVEEVSELFADISTATQEQASSLDQVSSSVVQLDRDTQQNATMVGEVTAAGSEMTTNAAELREMTNQFRLEIEPVAAKTVASGPTDLDALENAIRNAS